MIFQDRFQAGQKLFQELKEYQNDSEALILAIPRGGVAVAFSLSQELKLPIEITIAKKIGACFSEELAIAAVNEEGEVVVNDSVIKDYNISQEYFLPKLEEKKKEVQEKILKYRKKPLINLEGKKVIIVDDGIATGATIKAVIKLVRDKKAKKLIVAVPVASKEALEEIEKDCDQVVCLIKPDFFQAVGQFYQDFNQVTDEEVNQYLN